MSTPPAHPRIPYGEADFRRIRLNRWLYVDKTRFLRRLEEERYAFLIRPRRFGKSLWVSLLENYYDRFWADDFEATFAGTDIGQDPTGEQSRYVTLRFNFSMVNDKLETLEREFETYCLIELRGTLERHPDLLPEAARRRILAPPSIANKLAELFRYAGDHDIPLYVLIDEYDNFANTVLAYHGAEAYHSFTHGGGFYRNFFAALKGGADRILAGKLRAGANQRVDAAGVRDGAAAAVGGVREDTAFGRARGGDGDAAADARVAGRDRRAPAHPRARGAAAAHRGGRGGGLARLRGDAAAWARRSWSTRWRS